MPQKNYILDAHSQYYTSYQLSTLLKRVNYTLSSIDVVKQVLFDENDALDYLVARVIAIKNTGAHSYLTIYPRYLPGDLPIEALLGKCDDIVVRFSIFFNKSGFFSPLWTHLIKDGKEYQANGSRLDWDKYNNVAPKMSRARYSMLKKQAENSTTLQNDEVVLRTLPKWLDEASLINEDHWAW